VLIKYLRNARCSDKDVEFYSKNKFEKLVHLVGFIIRTYYDVRSPERRFLPSELLSHEAVCCVIDV